MKKSKTILKNFTYFVLLIVGMLMPISIHAATGDSYASAELVNVPSTTSVSLDFRWGQGMNGGRYYDYKFIAPSDTSVHIYTTGADTDTDLDIYDSSYNYLTGDRTGNYNVDITFNVTQGSTYILDLYNFDRSNYGNLTLHIEIGAPTPTGTTWVKNAAGTSAYTDPTPYGDNVDITETLASTTNSTTVSVTVSGETEPGYDYIYITDSANNTVQYDGSISATYDAVGPTVTIRFTSDGSQQPSNGGVTVSIQDLIIAPEANNDNFTTPIDAALTENVLDNDTGSGISVQSNTSPSNGSVTIQPNGTFVYTPTLGFTGSDSFQYTITDGTSTSTATVTILVTDATDYKSGVQPFVLINPPSTRNIIGDYAILGNTVECITEKRGTSGESNSYSGTCQDSNAYNDNNYMAKYIDIDGTTGIGGSTWNSSSSNFTLPGTYDQQGGAGILWAGIFWQGSINNAESYKQRRAYLDGSGNIDYKYITSDESIDLETTPGNKLLLRVDNDASYTPIQATTFYYDKAHGSYGGYYAAYRDITQILRDRNLAAGDHTITVANITANEGRQQGTGNYAGWSIVVIYKENDINGEPRNVSIYNGYTVIPNSRQVTISGFKLPKTGTVRAKFATFAGEGEYKYGSESTKYDRMVMKRLPGDAGDNMPGATDPDNIFDAVLANISRDAANDNDVLNANGIDVDAYDVSSIITGYRDIDKNIDTVYIGLSSNEDYVTPSMMAFSTELYKPGLCYDYTYDIGGYVLESQNNEVNTSYHHQYPILTTHVSIRSLEGDFQLQNSRFTVLSAPEYMTYRGGSAALAPNLIYGYSPEGVYNVDNPQPSSFTMDIGDNIVPGSGGTIEAYQTTYTRFQHDMNTSKSLINTALNMKVTYTVDYGSGPVPQAQLLNASAKCTGSGLYEPVFGQFNIVGAGAASNQYNLVSQVSSRPYNVTAYGYEPDNTTVKAFDTAIEVEIFNANFFQNDTKLSCNNPDSNITSPIFVQFNKVPSVNITSQQFNVAQRNAGYRVWYLEKSDGSIVEHHCADRSNEVCFEGVYAANYGSDTLCSTQCTVGGTGCYKCLRKFYGKPVCSRDNFSIRPEVFSVTMADSGPIIGQNVTTTPFPLAAGYNYNVNIQALAYGTNMPAGRYVKGFGAVAPYATSINPNSYEGATMMNGFRSNASCNNLNHEDFGFTFWQGNASNSAVAARDVGAYSFHVLDSTWTAVDQVPNAQGNLGCNVGQANIPATGIVGCNISSSYTNVTTGATYVDFPIIARPYRFDMSGLTYGTQAVANNYVYSNTLGLGAGIDNNMSISFTGNIVARGQDGTQLTNFVTGCYDTNISMSYNSVANPAAPTDINGNPLQMRWYERLATDIPGGVVGTSKLVSAQKSSLLQGSNFTKALQGSTQVDLRYNFDRSPNVPHDPFSLQSVSLVADCNVTAACTMNAGGVANYTPNSTGSSTQLYTNTATVLYARVNAPRKRVMCSSSSGSCTGSMLFFYEFYASQAADQTPATRALITAILPDNIRQRSLDSVNWYRNNQHNVADGLVTATTQGASVTPGAMTTQNGVTTAAYTYSGSKGYPYKDTVTITAGAGVEPWLIYDPYNANARRTRGSLEFYGPGSWTSTSGQKTSTGTKKKTNRRIRW